MAHSSSASDTRRYPLGNHHHIDMQQILVEAQNRWLRPAEICQILSNYHLFKIAPDPPNKPPNGSLFLFDRKVLRYFRKDGHNWRKKKDGKTVKEAHERLKSGSIDVLHCYYAHGEDNEGFQRRSYWLLQEELSHIVLVHYREVKGNRLNNNRINEYGAVEESLPNSEMETSVSSNFHANGYQMPTPTMDTASMNSVQASDYEDAESAYSQQATSHAQSFFELQQPAVERINAGSSCPASSSGNYVVKSAFPGLDLTSIGIPDKDINGVDLAFQSNKHASISTWEDVLRNYTSGSGTLPVQPSLSSLQPEISGQGDGLLGHFFANSTSGSGTLLVQPPLVSSQPEIASQGDELLGHFFVKSTGNGEQFGNHLPVQEELQNLKSGPSHLLKWTVDQKLLPDSPYAPTARFNERELDNGYLVNPLHQFDRQENDLQLRLSNSEHVDNQEGKSMYHSVRHHLLDGHLREPSLKKLDSFDRWVSKELCDVNGPPVQSSAGAYWDNVGSENGVDSNADNFHLSPSLSQEQLFSIIDFSPSWVYVGTEVKVLITGRFLKSQNEVENSKWSCMFGEVEVPAEVIGDGVLRCYTPLHRDGRVPFYITSSNRVACSEVREFEYRLSHLEDVNMPDNLNADSIENLHVRFGNLLCLTSVSSPKYDSASFAENSKLSSIISPLLKEENDEWGQMLQVTLEQRFSSEKVKEQFVEKLLKEKLHTWLLQKVTEGGKGPSVLDSGGQGVLHFASALGYDWALEPTIIAGVSVNFRDVNGWTALHWAASRGREHTVATLIHLGASPGVSTDPTPKYPKGRTPADLASANGHKGIAAYLAESHLSAQLGTLDLDKQNGYAAEIGGVQISNDGALTYELSSKDSMRESLAAVCKATQAAARIHEILRVQSFQKKQLKQHGDRDFGNPEERALSLLSVKAHRPDEPAHAAAIRIQNKFRGWKGRKEFLLIRQRIVKIQAHVRGHQVRKNYKTIVWSVGILEKVILRWRRKGSGLRGFRSEALPVPDGPSGQVVSVKDDDDDDFFRDGRKQTEERSQIALARVKSMLQYPEARDQYRRLRNVVTQIQERKAGYDSMNPESEADLDCLIDLDTLWDDDTFMNSTS